MIAVLLQSGVPLFPEQASTMASRVDNLYFFLVGVTLFFTVLISGSVIYFAIKYRRRSEGEIPPPITGSTILEALWIGVPLAIAMVMFFWGASVYFAIAHRPAEAIDIYVTGRRWMWKLQHMNGTREINQLHVPVGQPVRLIMGSEDVIHSFFVPEFRIKADVVPGRYTQTWFEATRPGRYHLYCAEYCGTKHSGMIGEVIVMEPAEYQAWLSGGGEEGSLAQRGQKLFQELGCANCHRSDAQARGPALERLFGREVQLESGGVVVADESYIRESILNPQEKVAAGFQPIMPTFQGVIGEEELLLLVAYIRSLSPTQPPATGKTPPTGQQQRATPEPQQSVTAGTPDARSQPRER